MGTGWGDRQPGTQMQDMVAQKGGMFVPGVIASSGSVAHCLNAGGMGRIDYETETMIAHALRREGFDASEDGTGRGTPIVPVAYSIMPQNSGKDYKARQVDVAQPLMAGGPVGGNQGGDFLLDTKAFDCKGTQVQTDDSGAANPPVAYRTAGDGAVYEEGDVTAPLTTGTDQNAQVLTLAIRGRGDSHNLEYRQDGTANAVLTPSGGRGGIGVGAIAHGWAVRRLTPLECTRLQGFPDDYFTGLRLNKPFADGPIYKMLGNSMAVNVMSWIGQRIAAVDAIVKGEAAS